MATKKPSPASSSTGRSAGGKTSRFVKNVPTDSRSQVAQRLAAQRNAEPTTPDRSGKRANWAAAKRTEAVYNNRLLSVAKNVKSLVDQFGGKPDAHAQLVRLLRTYADFIQPWAESVANYMLADVSRRNLLTWKQNSKAMGRALATELTSAPTGAALKDLLRGQVGLIQSLPLQAAQRVHELAQERLISSERSATMIPEIMETGNITLARARMIARTEVSRANATLLQVRAQFVGSEGYIWETSNDARVRPSHRKMQGKYVPWDAPPTTDGLVGHAGCVPNCRCTAAPVLPGETKTQVRAMSATPPFRDQYRTAS